MHQLQDQLSDLRVELCSVLQSLKEAHVLIDKHIDAASESATHEVSLKFLVAIDRLCHLIIIHSRH